MLLNRLTSLLANPLTQRSIFSLGFMILLLGLSYPLFGAVMNRDVPVEIDDSSAYIQRGIQMATCPKQDCKALEDLRPVFESASPDAETAFSRRDMFTRTLQNHIPLYSYIMSLSYHDKIGTEFYHSYYQLQAFTALVLAIAIAGYFLVQFGPVPAGFASMLVAATYFAGQGLINLVPVTLGWAFPLIAVALLIKFGNRVLPIIAILTLLAMGLHIIGKVYVILFLAFYIFRGSRPKNISDWMSLAVIAIGTLISFTLPYIIHRPSFDNPAASHVVTNIAEGIKDNILDAPRITERATMMVGGIIPMLVICMVAAFNFTDQRRRDFVVLLSLLGTLALISLLHVHSHYPADLFARTWIPFAIIMIGACAYVFWELLQSLLALSKTLATSEISTGRNIYILEPKTWAQLSLMLATLMLAAGFGYQIAQGTYAMYRAKIMYTHRQDFTVGHDQIDTVTNNCDKILYMHKDAMLSYLATGALQCGAVYRLAYNNDEWAKTFPDIASRINYAVTMNQMGQWKGWQPIGASNPIKLSFWPAAKVQNLRMRIRNTAGPTTITLREGVHEVTSSVPEHSLGWIYFDKTKIDTTKTYEIITGTNAIELGGLRLDSNSDLYWPWDQGVILSYHRDIPYQFVSDITFRYDSHEIFPVNLNFEVINDHEATVLAKRR